MANTSSKKSFDFRMSKKVAELTQVVHMLFTRNHEKEVELEALKEAYEHEIDLVIKDAKSKIEKLELTIRDLERKHHGDAGQFQTLLTQELARKEEEWRKRCAEVDAELQTERNECQNVRDLLINAQKDIERLKRTKSDELKNNVEENEARAREIDRLRCSILKLEKDNDTKIAENVKLKKTNDALQTELCKLKDASNSSEGARDELITKVKELENEVKRLRRELSRKNQTPSSARIRQPEVAEVPSAELMDYDEEMAKMKKQMEHLKLELRNREGNFNRMFTEKQPVFVDKRAGRFASVGGFHNGGDIGHFRYARERTYHPGTMRSTSAVDEDLRELAMTPHSASSSTSSSLGVFPHLPPGGRETPRLKTPKLMKPKPFSREMLSTRTATH